MTRSVIYGTQFMGMPVCEFDDGLIEVEVPRFRLFAKIGDALEKELSHNMYTLRATWSYMAPIYMQDEDGTVWKRLDVILEEDPGLVPSFFCLSCEQYFRVNQQAVPFCPLCGEPQ